MKTTILASLFALHVSVARADDAQVSSTVQQDFTISYKRPSGEPATASLSKGASQVGYTSVKVQDGGSVAITIADKAGEVVATGTVAANGAYLLRPKGDGFVLDRVGVLALGGDEFPGVVIVNALPESHRVDLFGHFGKIGLENVKIAKAFDVKQAIRIPAGDDRFKAVIHLADGSTVESSGMVDVGRYHVLHRTYDDKLAISSLGYIESARPKKATRTGRKKK
jgi:hypothetical protein